MNSVLAAPTASSYTSTGDQGQTIHLSSTPVSTGTLLYTYQWLQKTPGAGSYSTISGATSSSYSFVTSSSTATGSWSFELQVTDSTSAVVTSNSVPLTVNVAPTVSVSPTSANLNVEQTQVFTATPIGGTGNYTFYQWYVNGASQGFQMPATFSFAQSAVGSYSITATVSDNASVTSAQSSSATVTVSAAATPTPTPIPTASPTPVPNLPSPTLSLYCISSTATSGFNVQIHASLAYNGVGISGAGIQLSDSVTGGATWQDFAFVNTDANGSFSVSWNPSASGNDIIKATWSGDSIYSSVSTTVNFAVAPFNNQNQNVFSVTSNSTLTSLSFDSTTDELSFSVSGPSGTTGLTEVCIPQSLIPDISKLNVMLDGSAINYNSVSDGNVWMITFTYHHSSHTIVIALEPSTVPEFPSLPMLSLFIALTAPVAGIFLLRKRENNEVDIQKRQD